MDVLVVEPDKHIGEVIEETLSSKGMNVVLKRSAQTALDSLDDKVPNLIIIEPQLGLHNGIEFLYEIKSYYEWKNIPIIVYSSNARILDERFSDALAQLGVVGVLYKVRSNIAELIRTINKIAVKA